MKKLLLIFTAILLIHTTLTAQQPVKELESWAARQTGNINAGEVVEFLNGGRAAGDITFGSEYVFSSTPTTSISACSLDSTRFIVAFSDSSYSYIGTAMIGTISGNNISYSSKFIFNNDQTINIASTAMDNNSFVIAYTDYGNSRYGTTILGTISGNTISYSNEYVFNIAQTQYISIVGLSDDKFVVNYQDTGGSFYGASIVGTISGNVISFGSEYIFNYSTSRPNSSVRIDTNTFVVMIIEPNSTWAGSALVGIVSGSSITFGPKNVFNPSTTVYLSSTALNDSNFVVVYSVGTAYSNIGKAVLGTVSGYNILYGTVTDFNPTTVRYTSAATLNTSKFVISFTDGASNSSPGTVIIGTVSGNNMSFGSKFIFNSTIMLSNSIITLDTSHFVNCYRDAGNANYGTAIVGTIEGPPLVNTTALTTSTCPGTVTIPITVQNMDDVTDFSLILDYGTTNLTYDGYQNANTQLSSGTLSVVEAGGEITMAWNSTTAANITTDTLLELQFTASASYVQNTENLTWDDPNSYYKNSNGDTLSTVFNNGLVTIEPIVGGAGPMSGSNNVCQGATNESYQVDSIANATSYVWELNPSNSGTINGSGTNITIDYSATFSGQTTLSVYGSNSCGNGPSSSLVITVAPAPTANANVDDTVCENNTYALSGSATNQQSILWTTAGDGTFDDATSLTANYTPGSNDIASGSATLTLTAYAIAPCATNAVDDMILTVQQFPTANAGSNDTIGDNATYTLSGLAANQQSVLWTTAGDGTFDDATLLAATYTPGVNDIANDSVILTLTANSITPCATSESDNMTLYIQPSQQISLLNGWNIGSFYVAPVNMDLLNILQPLVTSNELTKVIDEQGGFIQEIPGFGWMNTIGNMANSEGYYIKVNQNTQLDLFGTLAVTPFSIPLSTGWNIMGYPTQDTADAITVVQPLIDSSYLTKIIDESGGFVQEIPGFGWMNTIGNFMPGEGYYIKVTQNCTLTIAREAPTVTTDNATGITYSSAISGGNITYNGGAPVTARGVCWSTSSNPTLADNYTTDGTGTGSFTSNITGLAANTQYYIRAYATNSEGTGYGNEVSFIATPPPFVNCGDLLTYEGQNYTTVQIGGQCWMAENLNVGIMIQGGLYQTNNGQIEKYCYGNDQINCDIYGGLYQWDEMMQYVTTEGIKGICPDGWHLPTDNEWKTMEIYLGMIQSQADTVGWRGTNEGGKLKEIGTTHWNAPNTGATNSSGFAALPGGYNYYGSFRYLDDQGHWWASTPYSNTGAWSRRLYFNYAQVYRYNWNHVKALGRSVRCLKDVNQPPLQPTSPIPADSSQNQSLTVGLHWSCSEPEGDSLTYDVYFSTDTIPILVASAITDTTYVPDTLDYDSTYFWKIVAHDNHSNTTIGDIWEFTTRDSTWQCGDTIVDSRDGQSYNTVQVGGQCWMAENLNVGTMILNYQEQTNNSQTEKYCYNNDPINCDVYGGLYQWNEMMQYITTQGVQGICPSGWHIPTDGEWTILTTHLGGTNVAGGKMKETGINHWNSPNTGATNSSGFTALPGGYWSSSGLFYSLGTYGYWWSSSESSSTHAWYRYLYYDFVLINRYYYNKTSGYSVRCIKD